MKIDPAFVSKLLADEADPIGALHQLANFWSPRASADGTGKFEGISRPERATHLFLWYYGEVGNGGHSQFLLNPMGSYAHETQAALHDMGLADVAEVLEAVVALFPERSIPKDRATRVAALEALDAAGSEAATAFARADRALDAIPVVPLHIRVLRYLSKHRAEVLQPEQP